MPLDLVITWARPGTTRHAFDPPSTQTVNRALMARETIASCLHTCRNSTQFGVWGMRTAVSCGMEGGCHGICDSARPSHTGMRTAPVHLCEMGGGGRKRSYGSGKEGAKNGGKTMKRREEKWRGRWRREEGKDGGQKREKLRKEEERIGGK